MGWQAHGLDGYMMTFKWDEGLCKGIPYVTLAADPCTYMVHMELLRKKIGMAMMQTMRKNIEGYI